MNENLTMVPEKQKSVSAILWVLVTLYALLVIVTSIFPDSVTGIVYILLIVGIPFAFAIVHGKLRYGWKNILFFIISCLVISNIYENVGVMTGFPFGPYYYTGNLGPKIFLVPVSIGIAYCATGYLSWILAHVLLGNITSSLSKANVFFIPLISSFIMVSWDLSFDPSSSTIDNDWIWGKGGGYYGVPFSNFIGWFLCVFTFYQVFALYISRQSVAILDNVSVQNKSFWYQAALLYGFTGLNYILARFSAENKTVTDQAGKSWSTADIYDAIALAGIFTMLFTTVLSLIRIKENKKILSG